MANVDGNKFTFHYGSILIWSYFFSTGNTFIYIPLWFYSNRQKRPERRKRGEFTFHYGSILMTNTKNRKEQDNIYIPLWFYSNCSKYLIPALTIPIYIPLWFYSNQEHIDSLYISIHLHSTMVLF